MEKLNFDTKPKFELLYQIFGVLKSEVLVLFWNTTQLCKTNTPN